MKRLLTVILVLILSTGILITGCASSSPQVEKTVPDFQLLNLEGQTVSLSDFRGSPVFLNFWASWCGPCRYEMPLIQEIYETWTNEPSSVVILTINIKEDPAKVKSFLETYSLSMPVLLDTDGDVSNIYNIAAIPTTFFIDKNGIIQDKVVGAFQNKEQIESYLNKVVP
ncbi:TlpA family protein disulfide reductase [Chloroflexota bacterium]